MTNLAILAIAVVAAAILAAVLHSRIIAAIGNYILDVEGRNGQ